MARRLGFSTILSVTLLAGACAQPAPPPPVPAADAPADLAALGAARAAFMAAYNSGDADAVGKLYMADAVSEPNHQPTVKGRDAIVAAQKAMYEHVSVKLTLTADETHTNGNAGFDRGVYSVEVTPKAGGPTSTVEGRYFVYYVKDSDGSWKVSRDMDNASTPMAPAEQAGAAAPAAAGAK
jgi:ketosteroid isomerase-like protein